MRFLDYEYRLRGVNTDLISIITFAAHAWGTHADTPDGSFVRVIEGLRTKKRQAELLALGKTKTMNSYHLRGEAVDVALFPKGDVSWNLSEYERFNKIVQDHASCIDRIVTWGGNWVKFRDGVHFQIETIPY